jgi:hypothetical protein
LIPNFSVTKNEASDKIIIPGKVFPIKRFLASSFWMQPSLSLSSLLASMFILLLYHWLPYFSVNLLLFSHLIVSFILNKHTYLLVLFLLLSFHPFVFYFSVSSPFFFTLICFSVFSSI